MVKKNNYRGLAAPLLILMVVGVALLIGVLVFTFQRGHSSVPAVSYSGWKTYTAKFDGLAFKYPPGWTEQYTGCANLVTHQAAECELVISPKKAGSDERFLITYSYNLASGVGRGPSHIIEATNLSLGDRKKPLQLVVLSTDTKNKNSVGGLFAVDAKSYKSGADVNDILTAFSSQKPEGYYLVMSASLVSKSQSVSLKQYKDNPEYKNVVGVFNSTTYK